MCELDYFTLVPLQPSGLNEDDMTLIMNLYLYTIIYGTISPYGLPPLPPSLVIHLRQTKGIYWVQICRVFLHLGKGWVNGQGWRTSLRFFALYSKNLWVNDPFYNSRLFPTFLLRISKKSWNLILSPFFVSCRCKKYKE